MISEIALFGERFCKRTIVPKIEALKMEAEIKAEKIGAEIQHRKDIREKKEEL